MDPFTMMLLGSGIGALGGLSSAKQAKRQREQDQKMNEIEARYSHWLAPTYRNVGPGASAPGMALGGAVSGGMMGAQLANLDMFSKGTGQMPTSPDSPLGGKAMAADLRETFNPGLAAMRQKVGAASAYAAPQVPSTSQQMQMPNVGEQMLDKPGPMLMPDATLDTNMQFNNPEVFPEGQQPMRASGFMDPRFANQFGFRRAGLMRR